MQAVNISHVDVSHAGVASLGTSLPDISQLGVESLWHPMTQHKPLWKTPPPHIVKGDGCTITTADGKSYLDAVAGIWCVNVGYGRQELAEVAYKQMMDLAYLSPTMSHEPGIKLAHKLLNLLDMEGRVYFSSSGSEANEAAFKMVWQYHAQSGKSCAFPRHKIIARHRAYHGNTLGGMSATGQAERKMGYGPIVPGFIHIPPPYPYRRNEHFTPAEHGLEMARTLEETIIHEGAESIAAFIMEPMISGGGVLIPPDEYLPAVRNICSKYGVLLIFDEVVSGFGRTGEMFGHQHWQGVQADIVTFAKGIASGYMPLAATAVRQEIFDAFQGEAGDLSHFRHINTYGGHPVATAVGAKNIQIIEEERLVENSRTLGAYFKSQLAEVFGEHPYVGEIRGKGLLIGIEMVADQKTKEPLETEKVATVIAKTKEEGVLIGRNGNTVPGLANVLVMSPPLIAQQKDIDRVVDALGVGLQSILF
ncbi:MAG: aminotransferase [Chloroflexota bacterium]